jgi:polyhydroxybutyrate depolymerase
MKLLLTLVLVLCTAAPAWAQVKSLVHQGEKRRYIVYTPPSYASEPNKAFPVVMNFHGGGMSMAEQMLYTQMNRSADRHQFIAVYPAGVKQDWNVGFETSYLEGTDDVGFTEALLAKLKQDYRVDGKRVYATGLSRGGFFALRLAAERPHLFAAVAAVGAPMPEPVVRHHVKPAPIGVLLVHGTADQVVAFDGKAGAYYSAHASFDYWLTVNGAAAAAPLRRTFDSDPGDGTAASAIEQRNGAHSTALVTVRDGGHTWPGADAFNVGLPIGKTSRDIDANELMWEFFGKHQL